MKNMYIYHAHISEEKTRRLIKCFAMDLTGTQTAELVRLNLNTVDRIFNKIRIRILEKSQAVFIEQSEFEADEAHFSSRTGKRKHVHGADEKNIVIGLYGRKGKVYTEIVPNDKAKALQVIIRCQADIKDVIHTHGWHNYDALVELGHEKVFRVHHDSNEGSSGCDILVNDVENFWRYAKRRLAKFKGIPKDKYELYLKETEFRFNARGQNIYLILLKEFRDNPLN